MEEIAHRVDEDHARILPSKWFCNFGRNEPKVKPEFVGMIPERLETVPRMFLRNNACNRGLLWCIL